MAKTPKAPRNGGAGKTVSGIARPAAVGKSEARAASQQPLTPREPSGNNPATRAMLRTPGAK